ncbi:ZIP family metal transporter [Sinorhizobium meliloti]|uniref:ZIP family metal transporter n=1 Tax=Rhizobium meliloti TaxID=382 RepID=UPI000B49A146|nr:metal transporter [Sinorhizobium meliloti]MDX1066517.1 metal transporter [Sinorhizobium medicae]ASQ15100.1 metal transporter [Sinorhizobium meliloti]MQU69046.1 metal transporter [Sinorhizobium meliloti]MQU80902.1 metal transporter [Sinorhizobium meliloti]MQU86304.1 metal transporter [Sinorhizobium meliloti]
MNENPRNFPPVSTVASSPRHLLWLVLPLIVLVAAVLWLLQSDPLRGFDNGAPPVENLTIERTVLDEDGLRMLVRAGGSEPMTIAQVQVDAAYWQFTQEPAGTISRGDTAWVAIPFPWVLGEAHKVTFVTNTGATFDHEIPVAVPTPKVSGNALVSQALLGAFVGILPVAIGLLCYPALRGAGSNTMTFLLALTVGLLTFLLVDTLTEALEFASQSAAIFQGSVMVILTAVASFLTLVAIGRRHGSPTGLALATYIAIGIGLHNFGEGLAIGAAFAAGAAGLGTFLVLGFTLHNITEGIGIAAPILKIRPKLVHFVGLTLLAGGPAVLGIWVGSLAFAPHWTAIALAIGAGAIAQVIVEVTALLARSESIRPDFARLLSPAAFSGVTTGLAFMYVTAMLVKI